MCPVASSSSSWNTADLSFSQASSCFEQELEQELWRVQFGACGFCDRTSSHATRQTAPLIPRCRKRKASQTRFIGHPESSVVPFLELSHTEYFTVALVSTSSITGKVSLLSLLMNVLVTMDFLCVALLGRYMRTTSNCTSGYCGVDIRKYLILLRSGMSVFARGREAALSQIKGQISTVHHSRPQ